MKDDATAIFERHAADYDALRRRLVPAFDTFYRTAVSALELAGRPLARVLDLGAGTGLLSQRVLSAYPTAELTLLDAAPAMLERARGRLGERVRYLVADLDGELPPGPWDAIVSALAIHHLDDGGKRRLSARAHAVLSPGGVFVNAEQVGAPTALFDDRYRAWHRAQALAQGASEQEWAEAEERMRLDRWATVERQLAWLREAGFADADCLYKDHRLAVIIARRGG
jgi:tRNA (cmo5U34)-methyltransferase